MMADFSPLGSDAARRGGRRLLRRLIAIAATGSAVAGGWVAVSIQPSAASGIFDAAVTLTGVQSVVQPGADAYLTATAVNQGDIGWLNATMKIDAGGKLDAGYTNEPSFANGTCKVTKSTSTDDIVTCTYGTMLSQGPEPSVNLAVRTPLTASSMTSVATITATPSVPATDADPSNNTATWVTTLQSNSGTGALTDGQSLTFTSADGAETTKFSVPKNATNGGVVIVQADEVDTQANGITCNGTTCFRPAAEVKWTQQGGTPVQANNPFTTQITYNGVKQACAGLGGPSGCLPIYYLPTGVTSGDAARVPLCTTYSQNKPVPFASHDPCVYTLQKSPGGVVTYFLAELNDQIIPISF